MLRTAVKGVTRQANSRLASTNASSDKYKILIVGGGSAGLGTAHQIYNRFKAAGKPLNPGDVAIVDAAEFHYYQPGWTLVGAGLKAKSDTRQRLTSMIPNHLTLIEDSVQSYSPNSSSVTTKSGRSISYESLVVAPGLQINWDNIKGLSEALANTTSGVSSIYSYQTADKAWNDIEALRDGKAIFTQPSGIIKCAGAPQKIMWMAWDRFRKTGRGSNISVDFYTGMPTMFSVKKYSDVLNALREERGLGGYFGHNLVSVDSNNHQATFQKSDGSTVTTDYTMLHVTPPMGPLDSLKKSPIVDAAGWVEVNPGTLQHVKPEFSNIWSLGDASSLPTSKTAAAITSQTPVLVENLFSVMDTGKVSTAAYDGYTSCPLLTGYGELLLAEFKYGLEPKESFPFLNQGQPNRLFYHLKKDLFPAAYWNFMVKGKWFGATGLKPPHFN